MPLKIHNFFPLQSPVQRRVPQDRWQITFPEFGCVCDFFLPGNLKQKVHIINLCNLEALEIEAENVILEITEGNFNRQRRMLCYEMCQECRGGHCIQHFL
jgi:hypothetical protein